MIYSNHHVPFCFIAVPKTGTTSMEKFLINYCETNDITYYHSKESNRPFNDISGKHVSISAVAQQFNLKDVHTIGFVRNPWDKVVSWFTYLKLNTKSIHTINSNISFECFLNKAPKFVFTQSIEYLSLSSGKSDVSFLGRYETIDKDFKQLCKLLKIEWTALPKLNSSLNKMHYSKFYTKKSQELIAEYFSDDIKEFKYTFEHV
jgi:hypothetical protein